jgi:hypothetical protein
MNIFVPNTDDQEFIAEVYKELSLKEHGGIQNMIICAFTNENEPISCIMDASDFNGVSIMAQHIQAMALARTILANKSYYEEMFAPVDDGMDDDGEEMLDD